MRTAAAFLIVLLVLGACSGGTRPAAPSPQPQPQPQSYSGPSDRVTVDHILIGVKSERLQNGTTPERARALAYDLLGQLRAGADWAALKSRHSADPPPGGPYTMTNHGVQRGSSDVARSSMVQAFGDVSFSLQVGQMGMADYDPQASPFGYHIIKRVK